MPGTIRVSVLEAVDLPEVLTDGTIGKDVTAKVTLGPKLFKTQPGVADGGKIASWNSDFAFPVMNLRDKLVISICNSEDHSVTQTAAIEIPSIIQKGSRDEFVALNKGGRIHLRMSFVLTEEERKKIESMRVAALKRKEEAERLKKTVVLLPVTPEKQPKVSPVTTVAITEVDVATTRDKKDLKELANGSLNVRSDSTILGDKKDSALFGDKKDPTVLGGDKDSTKAVDKKDSTILVDKTDTTITSDNKDALGDKENSTPKRPAPKPMFNYSKAIGVPASAKKTVKKPSASVSDSSTNELKADNDDVSSGVQLVRESTKNADLELVSSETTKLDASVKAPSSGDSTVVSVTKTVESTPQGSLIPAAEVDTVSSDFKSTNGGMNSELQNGRESLENTEDLGNKKLDGAVLLKTKPVDSVAQANPPRSGVESGVPENSTSEVGKIDKDGMDSEGQAARGSAEKVSTSRTSKLDFPAEDASPSSEHESSSLMVVSEDSAPHLQVALRSSSSGLKTVKARVKSTLSRVSSRRSSSRVASSNSLTRNPVPVPVVWVQEVVRRALSNVKGCYGLNPAAVHH
ncbi:hypothetical protein KC19_7G026600 [Ceratodon purpureus]|uniref:C2 domain-containing protein n=1 Tax=Ceratodon purpureus TaxID=3225 RepID=A0A8T0H6E4_CERPU|nr:hypothetical protein KC19_7G026600 [Ceratodon purpureus]